MNSNLTIFTTDSDEPFGKYLKDGEKHTNLSFWQGTYKAASIHSVQGLDKLIASLASNQFLCACVPAPGLPRQGIIGPEGIQRNGNNFVRPDSDGWMVIDIDVDLDRMIPFENVHAFHSAHPAYEVLSQALPEVLKAPHLIRPSSSTALGKQHGGYHVWVQVRNGQHIPELLDRCYWASLCRGWGYAFITSGEKNLSVRYCSPIDRAMKSVVQPVCAAAPARSDQGEEEQCYIASSRVHSEGDFLALSYLPDIPPSPRQEALKAELKKPIEDEFNTKKENAIALLSAQLIAKEGLSPKAAEKQARSVIHQRMEGKLNGEELLGPHGETLAEAIRNGETYVNSPISGKAGKAELLLEARDGQNEPPILWDHPTGQSFHLPFLAEEVEKPLYITLEEAETIVIRTTNSFIETPKDTVLNVSPGVGKTRTVCQLTLPGTLALVPSHALAKQVVTDGGNGFFHFKGRGQPGMCIKPKGADEHFDRGNTMSSFCNKLCPHSSECPYLQQLQDIHSPDTHTVVASHDVMFMGIQGYSPDRIIVDEQLRDMGVKHTKIRLSMVADLEPAQWVTPAQKKEIEAILASGELQSWIENLIAGSIDDVGNIRETLQRCVNKLGRTGSIQALRILTDIRHPHNIWVEERNEVKEINVSVLKRPFYDAPILLMDATADSELMERLIERPFQAVTAHVAPKLKPIQAVAAAYSKSSTTAIPSKLRGQDVISYKALNPSMHFGHLRGMNTLENTKVLFVVGRNQPPSDALEVYARAYSKGDFLGYARMGKHPRKINGRVVMSLEPTCELCWKILKQIRESEQIQAIGRARGVRHYKPVILISNLPLPMDVEVVNEASALGAGRLLEAWERSAGSLVLSDKKLSKAFPDLWPNPSAVRNDGLLTRLKNGEDLLGLGGDKGRLVRVRQDGQRGKSSWMFTVNEEAPEGYTIEE